VENRGTITALTNAVFSESSVTANNWTGAVIGTSATISAVRGVVANQNVTVFNEAAASIIAQQEGVSAINGTLNLTNAGNINAILQFNYTWNSTGFAEANRRRYAVFGRTLAADLINSGTISGGTRGIVVNEMAGFAIRNTGTISGDWGTAIDIGNPPIGAQPGTSTDSRIVNAAGASITSNRDSAIRDAQ